MKRLPLPGVSWLILCLCCAAGCNWNESALEKSHEELQAAREELRKCNESRQGMETVIVDQHKQIQTLQRLGDKRLEYLFRVSKIEMGSYTGGVQISSKEGDDGIKVYLRPLDQDASVIKAPGDVKIQLFDLALGSKDNMIGEYAWTADKIGKQWFSDFMTYYYSFVCPWKNGPPQHDEITIRVEFVDYLTGKTFVEQKLVKVKLPPPPLNSPRRPIAASQPEAETKPAPALPAPVALPPAPVPTPAPPTPPPARTPAPAAPKAEAEAPKPVKIEVVKPVTKPETPVKPVAPAPASAPVKKTTLPAMPRPDLPPAKVEPKVETPSPAPAKAEPKIELPAVPPVKVAPKVETPAAPPAKVEPKVEISAPAPTKVEPKVETPAAPPAPKIERPKKLLVIPDTPSAIAPAPETPAAPPAKVEPKIEPAAPVKAAPKVETPAAIKSSIQSPAKLVEIKLAPASQTRPAATSRPTTTTAPVLLDTLAPAESPKKSAASAPANPEPDLGGPPTFKPGK